GTATAWVWEEKPPGATASPYSAIHHNFSRDTPMNIRLFIEEWMFPFGPRDKRDDHFIAFTSAMAAARDGKLDDAKGFLTPAIAACQASPEPKLKELAKTAGSALERATAAANGNLLADALLEALK